VPQPQDHIGVFGRIGRRSVDRDLIKGELAFAAAGQLAITHGGMAKLAFGERIEPMRIAAGVQRIGHQLRVIVIAEGDAMLREYHGVEFDVEADLQNAGRFQQRPQRFEGVFGLDLVGARPASNNPAPPPDCLWASGT